MKLIKCPFFTKENSVTQTHPQHHRHQTTTIKTQAINNMHPPKTAKQVGAFLRLTRYYRKFIKNFAKMAKPLTLLTHQKGKFEWMPIHHTASLILMEAVTKAPYFALSWSSKMIHSIHRCIRWCIWSTTLTKNMMEWNSNSFSLPYLHRQTEKIEYHQTGSLQSIFMYLQSGTITSRQLKSWYTMTKNHWQGS